MQNPLVEGVVMNPRNFARHSVETLYDVSTECRAKFRRYMVQDFDGTFINIYIVPKLNHTKQLF